MNDHWDVFGYTYDHIYKIVVDMIFLVGFDLVGFDGNHSIGLKTVC